MSEFLLAPVKGCWYFCYWHWPECWGFSCVKSSGSGLHFLSLVSALGIGRHINGQLLKSSKLECSCQRGGKHCMYMYYVSMCVTVNIKGNNCELALVCTVLPSCPVNIYLKYHCWHLSVCHHCASCTRETILSVQCLSFPCPFSSFFISSW